MPWNIPILLTWSRILMIPLFTALFYLPASWRVGIQTVNTCAAALFVLAAVTDWFDGYLARKWKQTSDFGAFLDPVADKLMVAVAIIIGREITISALREWMAQLGKRNSVAVATVGKFKTAAQMAAITLLLLQSWPALGLDFIWLGNALMFAACVLTLWSMFYYLKMAAKEFKQPRPPEAG